MSTCDLYTMSVLDHSEIVSITVFRSTEESFRGFCEELGALGSDYCMHRFKDSQMHLLLRYLKHCRVKYDAYISDYTDELSISMVDDFEYFDTDQLAVLEELKVCL